MASERRSSLSSSAWGLLWIALTLTAAPSFSRQTGETAARSGEAPGLPASLPVFLPDDPIWLDPDRQDVERPRPSAPSALGEAVMKSVSRPAGHDDPKASYAVNVNTLGEVPDSSWFVNRHGRRRMSLAELRQGPDRLGPPAEGPWTIVGDMGEGRTAKFRIRDRMEREYIIKLDSPDHPELMSSAEVIGTAFFHSFGYHVPENYVVAFSPDRLQLEEESASVAAMQERWAEMPRTLDDEIRAVASLLLPGEPIGPFLYRGVREDDPNDVFPHQDRRELRGLRVFAAWLNHTDVKAGNSLDTYLEENGTRFVRHHLIDFGSSLGSAAAGAKDRLTGWEYYFEPTKLALGALGFGLWERGYVRIGYPGHVAVGNIEADFYEPWLWKPPIPNPAFVRMDAADAFWAARIVSRYTEPEIRALVSLARISDPDEERYLVDVLVRRQRKTVSFWLTRTNPLDNFRIEGDARGHRLHFENAALREGIAEAPSSYRYRWFRLDNETGRTHAVGDAAGSAGEGAGAALSVPDDVLGPEDRFGLRYAVVEVSTLHPRYPHWDRPVRVSLRGHGGGLTVVGVRRPREMPNGRR